MFAKPPKLPPCGILRANDSLIFPFFSSQKGAFANLAGGQSKSGAKAGHQCFVARISLKKVYKPMIFNRIPTDFLK